MGFSIGFFKKNSNTAPNNGTNDAVSLPPSPKIGYRANKAIKSAMDRRDSFTMNEFGDVAGNNFAEVKLKHFEDKAVLADQPKKAAAANDVAKILVGGQIDVARESHGPRATKKPLKPSLGVFGTICAKAADFFNVPTMKRANRMQDEMEYRFGCVAGNMLNLSHLGKSKEHCEQRQLENVNVAAAQKAVRESLVRFFEQRDVFVKAFGLGAKGLDGTRNCDRQIVSRLVHSLENAGDVDSLKRLHDVADEWVKDWGKQANGGSEDNVISIMKEIRNHIASRLGLEVDSAEETGAVQAENAAPEQPKPVNGLKQLINQWKSTLRSTLTKQVAGLKESCEGTADEMKVFQLAFEKITDKLRDVLGERDTDFSIDNLSVDGFVDVVDEMNTEIGKVIQEGKKIIDKLRNESKGNVLASIEKERSSYKEVDIEETNRYLRMMLTNTTANSDKLDSFYETKDLREVNLDAKTSVRSGKRTDAQKPKSAPAGASAQKAKGSKLLVTPAMDAVNKAIEAFSAAKHKLYHTIRPIASKLEGVKLLAKKELEPPQNPNLPAVNAEGTTEDSAADANAKWAADWKEACNAVGKYLLDGIESDMNNVEDRHLKLISDHKEYFSQGLNETEKKRLDLLFDLENLRNKGFEYQFELDGLAFDCSSFDRCKFSTTEVYGKLLDNVGNLEDAFAKLGDKFGVKRSNISEIWNGELKESCMAYLSPKVKIGVEYTMENRRDGVFFNGNSKGEPIDSASAANEGGTLCWISNEDVKDLATHLFSAIKRVGSAFAQDAAAELVAFDGSKLTEKRLALIKEGKEYLEPLIKAYRDVRGIITVNALSRISDGMEEIRTHIPSTQTKESWNELCDKAETAIKGISDNNVEEAVEVLNCLYDEIEAAASAADPNDPNLSIEERGKIVSLTKLAENFNADLMRIERFGERGKGVLSADLGDMHLDRMIWNMDNLMVAEWRARDMENLVSNALQSIPNFIKEMTNADWHGVGGMLRSKWLDINPDNFNISDDKLRKDFSDYAKSVKDYLRTLREEPLTSEKRTAAADAVRERLGVCIGSLAPVMQLMADIEVFMCERFAAYDSKDYEHKVRSSILVNEKFADRFVEMRRAVHNMFAALSEISKGAMFDVKEYVEEDKLLLLSGRAQYKKDVWDTAKESVLTVDYNGKRCKIVDHSVLAPVMEGTRDSHEMAHVRSALMNEYLRDSTNLSTSMLIRGSLSDDIFRSMEKVYLVLSKAKQNLHGTTYEDEELLSIYLQKQQIEKDKAAAKAAGEKYKAAPKEKLSPEVEAAKKAAAAKKEAPKETKKDREKRMAFDAVIDQIGRLVAQRTPIFSKDDLKECLRENKVDESKIATLDDEANSDFVENLVEQLTVLSSKLEVYEVKEYGTGWKEKQIVSLNEFLHVANVNKDYSVSSIDITNGEVTRVAVKSEKLGKEAYYTLKYTPLLDNSGLNIPGQGKIDFVPEANTNVKEGKELVKEFKPFSVKQTCKVSTGFFNREVNEVKFPREILRALDKKSIMEID